jgi:hypothetical protein
VSRLSRQCGILNISQPYRPPRPVTETALLFSFFTIFAISGLTHNQTLSICSLHNEDAQVALDVWSGRSHGPQDTSSVQITMWANKVSRAVSSDTGAFLLFLYSPWATRDTDTHMPHIPQTVVWARCLGGQWFNHVSVSYLSWHLTSVLLCAWVS